MDAELAEDSSPRSAVAYFGSEVRVWRSNAGLTQRALGERTNYGRSYVAMVEAGERLASPEFANSCDELFGTPGLFRRLRKRASERGYPDWFVPYIQLEAKAAQILNYSASLVPGILQTPEYARAVFRAGHPLDSDAAIEERVERRLRRREVLERERPPLLWAVINESCLRTLAGGAEVMRGQLAYLVTSARTPHITIQVLPFSAGIPPMIQVPFVLLTFDDQPAVLYAETPPGGRVEDSTAVVSHGTMAYDRLRAAALSPDDSLTMLRQLMEDYTV